MPPPDKALGPAPASLRTETLQPGHPWPMGAQWDGQGINYSVFSSAATQVVLCVFDAQGHQEISRTPLPARTGDIWHGYLPGAQPGLVYGLRADGPWRPDRGQLFNPAKLLLDPYAREVVGDFAWNDAHFGADRDHPQHRDPRDNAALALKARVPEEGFDWGDDHAPHVPLADTVLYELHVRGFSQLQHAVPPELRGSFAGLAHPASIAHLRRLGVTSLSLMPVHLALDEERLAQMGLRNYWGYNTIGFFCLDPHLVSGGNAARARDEFRQMVRTLHAAGLEVMLDVVYNHTAEAGTGGPTISFRGLDNATYYRLEPSAPTHYENHSGTGNTLDIRRPHVLRLVMDSLRYWVAEMHVDGFRFDLAPVLGRGDHGFERDGAFFTAVAQDPVLCRAKMIAEPWDIGPGGYQVGGFQRGWLEWNDQFRDSMRKFWVQGHGTRGEFARRLCGSSDLYQPRQRSPQSSVNYIVSHDGFTLRDLVSYNERHNQANGEDNRDGHAHNLSCNFGFEGPTVDHAIIALRGRMQRALLACTLLSQGTPMLTAGAELGHSQGGNNNAYCQDNRTSWIDWSLQDQELLAFTARLIAVRRSALPFDHHWYSGLPDAKGLHDLAWLQADGSPLQGDAWDLPAVRVLGCLIGQPGRARAPLLLLVNGSPEAAPFLLPAGVWFGLLDSADACGNIAWHGQGEVPFPLQGHSVVLMAAAGADVA